MPPAQAGKPKILKDHFENLESRKAELYQKSDLFPVNREITVEQALIITRNQGYKIKSATT